LTILKTMGPKRRIKITISRKRRAKNAKCFVVDDQILLISSRVQGSGDNYLTLNIIIAVVVCCRLKVCCCCCCLKVVLMRR